MALDCAKKRIIVGCDGTWMDADGISGQTPSNVTRILRAIPSVGVDEHGHAMPQVTFYQNGIGTGGSGWLAKNVGAYVNGATGEGMVSNIREAYQFVCSNYHDGDEIVIIGFSRGAFTARSIASLIGALGLLTNTGLEHLVTLIDDWEYQGDPNYQSRSPDQPWKNRGDFTSEHYQMNLRQRQLTRFDIKIKCVGVWDTVGALGVPRIAIFPLAEQTQFSFIDTKVLPFVEYAFHALAMDEKRRSYRPTIWAREESQAWPRVMRQTWFPGVHSDVGGSYEDDDLANLSLAWMMGHMIENKVVTFNEEYVLALFKRSREEDALGVSQTGSTNLGPRVWGEGKIHDSMSELIFKVGGAGVRTPGQYTTEYWKQKKSSKPKLLSGTMERIHPAVRVRMRTKGLGYNDKGEYEPESLRGWICEAVSGQNGGPHKSMQWRKVGDQNEADIVLPEEQLTEFEMRVLRDWHIPLAGSMESAGKRRDSAVLDTNVEVGPIRVMAASVPQAMASVNAKPEAVLNATAQTFAVAADGSCKVGSVAASSDVSSQGGSDFKASKMSGGETGAGVDKNGLRYRTTTSTLEGTSSTG